MQYVLSYSPVSAVPCVKGKHLNSISQLYTVLDVRNSRLPLLNDDPVSSELPCMRTLQHSVLLTG